MTVDRTAPSLQSLIRIDDLCKSYSLQDASGKTVTNQVLFDINLTIQRGEFVAIMGHSGSGKSTLMNILGCLDTPTSGSYWLDGQNVATLSSNELAHIRNQSIGFVFQGFNLLKRMTALDNVATPLLYAGISRSQSRKRALELLRRTGLERFAEHQPNQLSGGQQQRVAISRALINQPPLILADEPTGNLDRHTAESVFDLMLELNQKINASLIIVTHDTQLAHRAQRIKQLIDGVLCDVSEVP